VSAVFIALCSGCGTVGPPNGRGTPTPGPALRTSSAPPGLPTPRPASTSPTPRRSATHAPAAHTTTPVPSVAPSSAPPTRPTPSPTPTASPSTSTPRPTPTPTKSRTTPTPSPSPTATPPTAAQLQAALLTPADVGAGYVAQPVTGVGGSWLSACPAVNNTPTGTSADAGVAMTDAPTGAGIGESLFQVAHSAVAGDMAAFATAPTDCATFTGVLDGIDLTFTTEPMFVARMGSQTTAMRMIATATVQGQTITVYFDFVVIQYQNTLIVTLVSGTAPSINLDESVASAAYAKVAARW